MNGRTGCCREFEYDEKIEEDVGRWARGHTDLIKIYDRDELLARREGLDRAAVDEEERLRFADRLLNRAGESS
jgi:hypothetical protein